LAETVETETSFSSFDFMTNAEALKKQGNDHFVRGEYEGVTVIINEF
jgi:hypothetical protein